jgi:hypothetical protein
LVDAEERALETIKDAIDGELFAGLSEAPANLPTLFKSYCFHAANRNAPSSSLKYFVRLAVIGSAYCYLCPLTVREFSVRFVACSALPPRAIHEGKMILEHFRWGRTDVIAADARGITEELW